MKQLFVAWVPFQRRSVSMQKYFNYDLYFLAFSFKKRFLRPLEYVLKSLKTLGLFITQRPDIIWVQLPPTPLLYLAFLYQSLTLRKVTIIADCHNATFRPPWVTLPKAIALLQRCGLVLVHSEQIEQQAIEMGISIDVVYLLEDPTTAITLEDGTAEGGTAEGGTSIAQAFSHPWVLCPCSFNRDEPIGEIFAAARLAPEVTFVLTGNFNRAEGIHDLSDMPKNVVLTGFLPVSDFNVLLLKTDVVGGFTQLDGIQLSAAVEATAAGVPMLLSETTLLKDLFYKGAIHVDSSDAGAIAEGCRRVLAAHDELTLQVAELKDERAKAWLKKAKKVRNLLEKVTA